MKIPEVGAEAEVPCWITETEKHHIRREGGATIPWLCHPSLRPVQHCTKRVPLGLWFLHWEKENPKWIRYRQIRGGRGLQQSALSSTEAEMPARGSAHLQSWASSPFQARDFVWSRQFCLIWVPSQQAIFAVETVLWPHPGREENSQPAEYSPQSYPTRKPGQWTQVAREPSMLEPCLHRAPGQKAYPTLKYSLWSHITRESEQWPWVASKPSLWYHPVEKPSLQPHPEAEPSIQKCPIAKCCL